MVEEAGCPWCARWNEEIGPVYGLTEEGRRAPLRRVDIHGDWPEGMERPEGLAFTPTFVLVEDGREVGRITGYPGEDFFWPLLQRLMERLPEGACVARARERGVHEDPAQDNQREGEAC